MPDLKNRWPLTTHAWIGIFLLCIIAYPVNGQHPSERGNLRQVLRGLQPSDTNYINTLFKFGETYELENNDSAFYYYHKGYELSKKINYISGQLRYRDYTAVLLVYLGRYDEAMHHLDSAMEISTKNNRRRFQATEYNHYGTIWQYKSEMHKAAEYYMRAYSMAESIHDSVLMNAVAGNISGVFLEIRRYDKAREFSQLNYDIAAAMRDTLSMAYGLVNLSSCELEDGKVAVAKLQSQTAITIARQFADEGLEMFALYNLGTALRLEGKPDSAILVLTRVREMARVQDIPYHGMYAAQGLGDSFSDLGNFPRAIQYYEQALDFARRTSNRVRQAQLYLALAANHEKHGTLAQSVNYWKQYNTLNDSINVIEQNRNVSELEASYQSERKQRELSEKSLQVELEKNKAATRLIWIGGMSALLITAFFVILLRIKISRVREQNLKNEMQVKVLKAGENERSRIAKDLHDDVGATLSSIHIYSKAAEMHMLTKPEEVPILVHRISENSERMMDKMSDIIWSMNSNEDAGEKLVLRIKTFASEILGSKEIDTSFDLDALENIDISIFARKNLLLIFKEAINNIAKYSQARKVSFRCFSEAGSLGISIKDDGVGFDVSQAVNGNGMGNMKHRAGLLGGMIEIDSSLGSGSSIMVRIPIAKISDGVTGIF